MAGESSGHLESWYSRLRNLIINANIVNTGSSSSAPDSVFSSPTFHPDGSIGIGAIGGVAPVANAEETDYLSPPYGSPHMSISGEFLDVGSKSGWLALHEAAARNDSEVLAFLLKHAGTFVDVLSEENETPLFLAVKHGHVAAAKQLIKAHCSLNVANIDGLTALSIAVQNENLEMIGLLLKESDCDVDHREHHGWAALHEASRQGNRQVIQMLLKAKAHTNILTNLGETPIYIACKYGHVSCVEILLRHDGRANISNSISGQTPLFIAANKNHVDCVTFLINYAADPNISNKDRILRIKETVSKDGLLPLHTAVWANSIACLKALIPVTDRKKITDYSGMTPVQLAVFKHNVEALQVLIENGFDVNAVATSGAEEISSPNQSGSASYTFTHFGSVTNLRLKTPLFLASLWNHETCIKLLLDANADPNKDDPLKFCISNNRVDMCNLLVRHGAIIRSRHMYMAKSNEMLQLLLICGLDPTSLFESCRDSHSDIEHCALIDDWLIKHFATPEQTLRLVLTLTGNVNKCMRFEQTFPQVLPNEPRKLKNLVRIFIRSQFSAQKLIQSRGFFALLNLPNTLLDFLCCPELAL